MYIMISVQNLIPLYLLLRVVGASLSHFTAFHPATNADALQEQEFETHKSTIGYYFIEQLLSY